MCVLCSVVVVQTCVVTCVYDNYVSAMCMCDVVCCVMHVHVFAVCSVGACVCG